MCGLGLLRSQFDFVKKADAFWDTSAWDRFPRPFLDDRALAYAHATTAWIRSEPKPTWDRSLPSDVRTGMSKSLKFLLRTGDSFLDRENATPENSIDWEPSLRGKSVTKQIIALNQLESSGTLPSSLQSVVVEKLRSANEAIVLHAIAASEAAQSDSESVGEELRYLTEHRNDEVRAKSMIAVSRLGLMDDATTTVAAKMIDSQVPHVTFAGLLALASLPTVSDEVLEVVGRGYVRALQNCQYEFVTLYTTAFTRWLGDAEPFLQRLLGDHPEYQQLALEAIQEASAATVSLKRA